MSTWKSLTWAISSLFKRVKSGTKINDSDSRRGGESAQVTTIIIRVEQQDVFLKERQFLAKQDQIPRQSPLVKLSKILDEYGFLRFSGHTSSANLCFDVKHPMIIPKTYTATLFVKHYRKQVAHQGHQFTEDTLRSAGLWLTGGNKNLFLHNCIICKKGTADFPTETFTRTTIHTC